MVTIIMEIGKNIKFSIFGTRLAEDVAYQMASVILSGITTCIVRKPNIVA
jgi:hypothetical protein